MTKAEDINIPYGEALEIAPPGLRRKMQHSVELIRKAEKIALKYDSEDGFYNTFSGGKDSQALYHIVKMAGVKFKTHMSLTSVDPPQVIRFVKSEYPSVIRHKPKMSIYQDAVERKILPTMRVRWCCADFKESAGAGKVTLIGIRAKESSRRAKRHEVEVSSKKFSGNLEEFEQWIEEQMQKQQKRSKRKINEDEFSVNTDNEVRCISGKDSILVSPIFDWTENDVWYFLNNIIKAPHCSLYDEGYTRIGCILCPMSTAKSKQRDIQRFPHVKRNWIKAIKAIRGGGIQKQLYLVEHPRRKSGNATALGQKVPYGKYPSYQCQEGNYGEIVRRKNFYQKAIWTPNTPPPPHTQSEVYGESRESEGMCNRENSSIHHGSNGTKTGYTTGQQTLSMSLPNGQSRGFSDSPAAGGVATGQWTEDEIAEAIFDWWISGKPYKQWYAEKYLQLKFEFDDDNDKN